MKRYFKVFIAIILFFALSFGSGFYFTYRNLLSNRNTEGEEDSVLQEAEKNGHVNILLLGLDAGTIGADEKHNRYRSDTMMLFSLDLKDKKVNVLSIPRDTRVVLPGEGFQKINAAMAYGGPDLAVDVVSKLLNVPVHYYVTVNYEGFKKIVDAIGGIEIEIDRRMKYDDNAGNLHIDLKPGFQVLDGEKAEQFVRFRHYPEGDIARVRAQQKFIKATAKALLQPANILKIPRLIQIVQENVKTDISPVNLVKLANFARQLKEEDVETYTLPGTGQYIGGVSYFIPEEEKVKELVNAIFYDKNGIKVAVLNGSGYSGVASEIAKKLESMGFTVVKVANADSFDYDTTTVLYPKEKPEYAKEISKILNNPILKEDENNNDDVATIILGKDIKNN
ncbi:LCP family protein [Thermovenabulum gondwanense]|uniref:Regulatory protein MsrR n=1 Tax=Thermovenabulum gondwanense TaxID=520767 RepID=A0A162M9Z3_9FIRM|nr:LCP family protein [Thermovenabulum gondwanense]KYO64751.1 Regulatory protein MsrR [Thermovenabulum gondwanense]